MASAANRTKRARASTAPRPKTPTRARPPKLPEPKGWEYVKVRDSRLHGRGLFAAVAMRKGTRVMEYVGERVGKREGNRRTEEQWAQGRMYMFNVSRREDLDGSVEWNVARLANYSCDPNCESENDRGHIWIVAKRDIAKGDELTYDYNFDFTDPPAPCNCGAANCRGYILGKHALKELRAWLRRGGLAGKPQKGAAHSSERNPVKRVARGRKSSPAKGDGKARK